MSTTHLDPTVVSKLQHFSRRRFRLILMRGFCAALVTFVICMSIVAFLDWGWVLNDGVRWALSAAAYLLTTTVVWIVCGRKIINKPAHEEIASQVENAQPELREHLLSAVELATENPEAVHDSPIFRSLLQEDVARQMSGIQVGRLLPIRLLKKWLVAAAVVVAAIAVLMTSGGSRFRNLAARAILPMANVDRVSHIQVEILQPTPHSLMIANDETVAIVVQTSGGIVDEAILETRVAGKPAVQQSMRSGAQSEFSANLHVDDDAIEYRILAGDAVTRRYTINSRNRPRVVRFHKTFQYPKYAARPDETVTEDHGNIVVLQGTQVQINVDVDQDVSEAQLRIDESKSDEPVVIDLVKDQTGQWSAEMPVEKEAIYKVHLVSSETGFENTFGPRYEIRPQPDLIPRAGFVDQHETNLLLPPNDILALKGMAEDDLPLETLHQEFSVNGREWISVPLDVSAANKETDAADERSESGEDTPHRITAAWGWDLLELQLKTGDQVTTRLVATDLKGNRGESVPLRIVISAPDFDPDRHRIMEQRAELVGTMDRFATTAAEHKTLALEIVDRLKEEAKRKPDQQRSEAEVALDCTTVLKQADGIRSSAVQTLQHALTVTKSMPAGVSAYELDLVGRILAKIIDDDSNRTIHAVEAYRRSNSSREQSKYAGQMKDGIGRAADNAKNLAYHYKNLVAQDIFSAFAGDFSAILRQQSLIADNSNQTFLRLRRHETLVVNQLQAVERMAKIHRRNLPNFLQNHVDHMIDWTDRWIGSLEQAMESEDQLPRLQQHAKNLRRELGDRQRYDVIDGGMATRLTQARREFDLRAGSLAEPLSLMSTATHEENRRLKAAGEAGDSTKATTLAEEASVCAAEVDFRLRPALGQLRRRRMISQARADSDTQFAADAGMTHRATISLVSQHRQEDPESSIVPTAFREIAPAYRILEAGHDIANVQQMLDALIASERWKSLTVDAITQHPRHWDAVYKGLEEAVNRMRQAGINNAVVVKFDQLRWCTATKDAGRKIAGRRWKRDKVITAADDLMDLQKQLSDATMELMPVMDQARAVIAKYSPTIPEMAEQLAQRVREMEKNTMDAADAFEQPKLETPPNARQPSANPAMLKDQHEQINQQLDDLFEALVEDANQQDLMDEVERERARDADDSIAMIQEPAENMDQAMQESQHAEDPKRRAKALAQAAEQQKKTAEALDVVARHFDRLAEGEDIAASRETLRQMEREIGLARQMNQQLEDVERLALMTTSTQQSLMDQLEAELQNNPSMREALSEIAQDTVEQARNALEDASNRDKDLQKTNERSDQEFQERKKQLAQQLRDVAREASNLSNKMIAQAESAASQAKTPEAKQKFHETRQNLQLAAQSASGSQESELLQELAERAKQTSEAMKDANQALQQATQKSAAATDNEIHADDIVRKNAKQNLENQRKRFSDQLKREADSLVRQKDSAERKEAASVRNAKNNLKKFERDLQQAKKKAHKKPDDRNLKKQIQRAEDRKRQAEKQVKSAEKKQQNAQQGQHEARKAREILNSFPQQPLDNKNPAAQLAESLAQGAAEKADELLKKAESLLKQSEFSDQLSPTKQQLAAAIGQQQNIAADVSETGEDISRAARHERRLSNEAASEVLQEASSAVKEVAENEATDAIQQLEIAEAATSESQQGKPGDNNKPALAANQALQASERAIAQQAQALTPIVDAAGTAEAAEHETSAPPGGATPKSFSPEELARGRQLAQALDEIDQSQAMGQGLSTAPAAESGQLPRSLAKAAKARAAMLAQQRSQARQQQQLAKIAHAFDPNTVPQLEGQTGDFLLKKVDRSENEDWGDLRTKEADDLTKGRREAVSAEYRKSVEAYFKVLAERARRQNAK